jgi:hypothetical protein
VPLASSSFDVSQVKVQTVPGYARGLADGMPKFVQQEGLGGLYKGLTPLWGRQIPYTMMKFGGWAAWLAGLIPRRCLVVPSFSAPLRAKETVQDGAMDALCAFSPRSSHSRPASSVFLLATCCSCQSS